MQIALKYIFFCSVQQPQVANLSLRAESCRLARCLDTNEESISAGVPDFCQPTNASPQMPCMGKASCAALRSAGSNAIKEAGRHVVDPLHPKLSASPAQTFL